MRSWTAGSLLWRQAAKRWAGRQQRLDSAGWCPPRICWAAVLAICWFLGVLLLDRDLAGHKVLLATVNKCVYQSYRRASGGYRKSGRQFQNVSDVFRAFQSSVGLRGFLNFQLPSDKAAGDHNYNEYYDELLAPYVQKTTAQVLEIGVKMGGSLMLWRELFPREAFIYGIDIDYSVPMFEKDAHIKVLAGMNSAARDGQVSAALEGMVFDVIVDDGSHLARDQLHTVERLWSHLAPDGVYIIEDVENDCAVVRQVWWMAQGDAFWRPPAKFLSLREVAQVVKLQTPPQDIWVTVHQDQSGQQFVVAYPTLSEARAHIPGKLRCAMGGAPGPPCEDVMQPCGRDDLRTR